jgi:prolipoprotein diacylglyceryl transferase
VTTVLAYIPSPPRGVWYLGWLPIRAYALFIIIGIVVALVIGDRRWVARGGQAGVIYDIALWAVPFGLVGGRLYHVMTDWRTYFGAGGVGPLAALKIWDGGLGIWGAVALGGVGAWIACRRRGIPLPAFGDAIAPGIILAQAIGRIGNYFNQELYGRDTTVPWGLEIYVRRDASGAYDSLNGVSTGELERIVHPTFLYELIWNVLIFVLLIVVDRRLRIGHGRLFALYVAGYCAGRFWVELMRSDTATHIAGIRINSFTSTFVFIGAVVYIILAPKGREDPATLGGAPAKVPEEAPVAEKVKELAAVTAAGGVVAAVGVATKEHEDEAADAGESGAVGGGGSDGGEAAERGEAGAGEEPAEEGEPSEGAEEGEPSEGAEEGEPSEVAAEGAEEGEPSEVAAEVAEEGEPSEVAQVADEGEGGEELAAGEIEKVAEPSEEAAAGEVEKVAEPSEEAAAGEVEEVAEGDEVAEVGEEVEADSAEGEPLAEPVMAVAIAEPDAEVETETAEEVAAGGGDEAGQPAVEAAETEPEAGSGDGEAVAEPSAAEVSRGATGEVAEVAAAITEPDAKADVEAAEEVAADGGDEAAQPAAEAAEEGRAEVAEAAAAATEPAAEAETEAAEEVGDARAAVEAAEGEPSSEPVAADTEAEEPAAEGAEPSEDEQDEAAEAADNGRWWRRLVRGRRA